MTLEIVGCVGACLLLFIIATMIVEAICRDMRRAETLRGMLASNPKLRDLARESGITVAVEAEKPGRELRAANGRWSAFSGSRHGDTIFLEREGFPGFTTNQREVRALAALLLAMADALERADG